MFALHFKCNTACKFPWRKVGGMKKGTLFRRVFSSFYAKQMSLDQIDTRSHNSMYWLPDKVFIFTLIDVSGKYIPSSSVHTQWEFAALW